MITIQLGTIAGHGTVAPLDTATFAVDGAAFTVRSRSSAVCRLARVLRDRGMPDQPWIAVRNSGKPSMRGPSLYAIADRTISEGDRTGLRWVKFSRWNGPDAREAT